MVLDALVAKPSVLATIVGTSEGEVVALRLMPADLDEAAAALRWAADQLAMAEGLLRQTQQDELGLLFDDSPWKRAHAHIGTVGRHILVVLFGDRDCLGSVRLASREAAARLATSLQGAGWLH